MQKKLGVAIAAAMALGFVGGALFYNGGRYAAEIGHMFASSDHQEEAGHGHAETGKGHGGDEHGDGEEESGAIHLSAEQIAAAGIELSQVQARAMSTFISLPGDVRFDEERTAHVVPPSSGIVERVLVELGQVVKKDEALAIVASQQVSDLRSELAAAGRRVELARTTAERERQLWQDGISAEQDYLQARQALQEAEIAFANARQKSKTITQQGDGTDGSRYSLRAPFAGMVVEKHLVPGEVVSEASNAFTVADMSRVWVTFSVSPRDLGQVRAGQSARISAPELGREVSATVAYVSPLLGEQTRTASARISLENPDGIWRPGLFVSVALATESHEAKATVPADAIQEVEEVTSVFVRTDEGFEVRPVTLGTRSEGFVEILDGLSVGERVAASGSFILKSELGKGSAEHAH
ncbi:efflux RND transporter periplasmic adaptor subunit [Pseudomonas sp. Marseille-Q0931]|uniref:efflux RND transporter periplasmic adaptor subunit n=1 Tax=Pseudomonas sp. Marseille-Q0931 TaxID=2697507 RepID=UPI0023B8BC7F|nr:efflux RND transporter periplasmic adaptor subunit [Pseudomonas sp. Marseille-Q0931]